LMSLMVSREILAVAEDRENQTISDFSVKSFLTKGFGRGIGPLPRQLLEEQDRQGIKKPPGRRVAPTPGRAAGRQGLEAAPLKSRPIQAQ
jgi:hypothetical protein